MGGAFIINVFLFWFLVRVFGVRIIIFLFVLEFGVSEAILEASLLLWRWKTSFDPLIFSYANVDFPYIIFYITFDKPRTELLPMECFPNANHSIVQIKTIHSYLVHSPHGHRIYFPIFLHRSVRRHTYIIIIMKNTQNSPTHTCTLRCTPLFIHSLIRQCTTCMRLAVFLGWDRRLTAVILSHKIWFYHT